MKREEKRFIVVDENNTPMAFEEDQFCYVPRRCRSRFKLKHYSEKEAKKLIKQTIAYRKQNNFEINLDYYLMPIEL